MQRAAEQSRDVGDASLECHATRATRAISTATAWLGSFPAILLSTGVVVAWFIGSMFVRHHLANNTYQLVINTGTTIVTFIMVFIIQNTQNREGRAVQAKLDAQADVLSSIARTLDANDHTDVMLDLVGVEDAPERRIEEKQRAVRTIARQQSGGAAPSTSGGDSGNPLRGER